jgi:hypothetical protein
MSRSKKVIDLKSRRKTGGNVEYTEEEKALKELRASLKEIRGMMEELFEFIKEKRRQGKL